MILYVFWGGRRGQLDVMCWGMLGQHRHNVPVMFQFRPINRCLSLQVSCIDRSTHAQQKLDHRQMVQLCRPHQGSVPIVIPHVDQADMIKHRKVGCRGVSRPTHMRDAGRFQIESSILCLCCRFEDFVVKVDTMRDRPLSPESQYHGV